MSDIYKAAAQTGLRFASERGNLTVENLFQLPLSSEKANAVDLDRVGRAIVKELKAMDEESLVSDKAGSPRKKELELALAIVKDVIDTKKAENKAALERSTLVAEKQKIQAILAAKKDEKLGAATEAELEARLAAINAQV